MTSINLIPVHRLEARARRARVRRWCVAATAYALLLAGSCVIYRAAWGASDTGLEVALQDSEAQIQSTNQAIAVLQTRLDASQFSLNANRELREHPDWSLLLGLLSSLMDDDLILRECSLDKITPRGSQASSGNGDHTVTEASDTQARTVFMLAIKGMGRSQEAVSQFTLRLEQTRLFAKVKLVDTSLEPFLSGKAVAFQVECSLESAPGGDR